ncbi:MAG: nitrile hydratase accessory protein, partial [Beijerinckiaceae bacterium]
MRLPEAALPEGCETPAAFAAPWEAQAFALAVHLHERGVFAWPEFGAALSAEIARIRKLGEIDDGVGYYRHWLAALENLLIAKDLTSAGMLGVLKEQWDRA